MTTHTAPSHNAYAERWPKGVTHRYANLVGATIDIRSTGVEGMAKSTCAGCDHHEPSADVRYIREQAQRLAEKCRALPRPAVS